MSDWPEELCKNCGKAKEEQTSKYCIHCSMLLEPTERIEIKITKRFLQEIKDGMDLGGYGIRAEFIRESIRHYIRYLKGELESKNVIEGIGEDVILERMKMSQILKRAAQDLEGGP